MNSVRFNRYALIIFAVALLAGCGGSQPPIGAPGAMPQTSALATHADRGKSWMLPEAKSEDLLYVTNYSHVSVYTYPKGKLVGILNGFGSSVGECVDGKGDVFVTNTLHLGRIPADRIVEYAHGGMKPIAELKTEHVGPVGCAFDPTTGDLAVSGFGNGWCRWAGLLGATYQPKMATPDNISCQPPTWSSGRVEA